MADNKNIGRPANNIYTVMAVVGFCCLLTAVIITWNKNVELTEDFQDNTAQFKNPMLLIERSQ